MCDPLGPHHISEKSSPTSQMRKSEAPRELTWAAGMQLTPRTWNPPFILHRRPTLCREHSAIWNSSSALNPPSPALRCLGASWGQPIALACSFLVSGNPSALYLSPHMQTGLQECVVFNLMLQQPGGGKGLPCHS